MLRLLCAAAVLAALPLRAAAPPDGARTDVHASAAQTTDPRVVKALEEWLRIYLKGKFEIATDEDIQKTSIARKYGLLPKSFLGHLSRLRELELLLEQGVEEASEDFVEVALEIAAVGMDGGRYEIVHQPHRVRTVAEQQLAKVESATAKAHVLAIASGEVEVGDRKREEAIRAAAVRMLGRLDEPAFRPALEEELGSDVTHVRIAAAQGIGQMASDASLAPLANAIAKEENERALEAMVNACVAIMDPFASKPDEMPRSGLDAVRAAISALGRTGWRADSAIVHFLEKFRNAEAIPQLIKVLEKFVNHPDDVASGRLSGILRHRAHEVLVSLTGAIYPMDRPDQWREFWEREKQGFKLAKQQTEPAPGEANTVSSGFFGIPVQGTRVMFVVDISGSMAWPMPKKRGTGSGDDDVRTRWDAARKELKRAVDALSPLASFNVVIFNDRVDTWMKEPVAADKRNKARFERFIDGIRPMAGTNLYGGMQTGLKMKSLVWSDRYETHVDEMFLLSDGAPSVGEVTDMDEILRLIAETNRWAKVRLNTVFITSDDKVPTTGPMATSTFMKRLAEENGGKCVVLD